MDEMNEFNYHSAEALTAAIAGRTVTEVRLRDEHGDDYLEFVFSDGAALRLRYDWIFEWGISTPESEE